MADWHKRFMVQAGWTQTLRRYVYAQTPSPSGSNILEVGCGTGAILTEFSGIEGSHAVGLDLSRNFLDFARSAAPKASLCQGNAFHLPFPPGRFQLVCFHYLLLWLADPLAALLEMARVAGRGGVVAALAEPDYGGRIDHPAPLERVGKLQAEAIRRQGADPDIGRKLAGLFAQAGLQEVQTGVMGGQWQVPAEMDHLEDEWRMLRLDLQDSLSPQEFASLMDADRQARSSGARILYVPTFYAIGRVEPG